MSTFDCERNSLHFCGFTNMSDFIQEPFDDDWLGYGEPVGKVNLHTRTSTTSDRKIVLFFQFWALMSGLDLLFCLLRLLSWCPLLTKIRWRSKYAFRLKPGGENKILPPQALLLKKQFLITITLSRYHITKSTLGPAR